MDLLTSIQALFGLIVMIKVFYYFIVLILKCFGLVAWEEEQSPAEQTNEASTINVPTNGYHQQFNGNNHSNSLIQEEGKYESKRCKSNKAKKQQKLQKDQEKKRQEESKQQLLQQQQEMHRQEIQRLEELKRLEEKLRLEQQQEIARQVQLKLDEMKRGKTSMKTKAATPSLNRKQMAMKLKRQ